MTSMKSTSQTRLVKNKYKLDCEPFQMSQFEWRGTLNNSELIAVIKYNLGAWKVKYAETEDMILSIGFANQCASHVVKKKGTTVA